MYNKANKIILVTGATGRQGSATVRHLLADGWSVRAITRHPESPAALALKEAGVDVFFGDNADSASLKIAMQGVYGVFSVQPTEFSPDVSTSFGYDVEVQMGKNVADAAKEAGIQHFVCSSVNGSEYIVGSRNYSKWEIEQYVRSLGIPFTIVRPVWFMETFTDPKFGLQYGTLATGIKADIEFQLIAADDIGAMAAVVFGNPDKFIGKAVDIAGDCMTPVQLVDVINQAMGTNISYVELPVEHKPGVVETYEYHNNGADMVDLEYMHKLHPGMMTVEKWLEKFGKTQFEKLFESNQ